MHFLSKLFPSNQSGENPAAVKMFRHVQKIKNLFRSPFAKAKNWPLHPGRFVLGNQDEHIAVCTLTDSLLMEPMAQLRGVAIAGMVYTPNLGIETMIQNIISNLNIRFLLLCGKDSPVFHPGQAIQSLFSFGINEEKRIQNAIGHYPVLRNISEECINTFLTQIELISCIGEQDASTLSHEIEQLNLRRKGPYNGRQVSGNVPTLSLSELDFIPLKAGGRRSPNDYDTHGFFVITVNPKANEIILKHYSNDNKPGFIVKGHSGESILLAVIEKGLVTQLSHAGYLGRELNKAEVALRFNFKYEQDQPLKPTMTSTSAPQQS